MVVETFERGLLILPCGASTLRLSPPLVCTDRDADMAVSILDAACTAVAAARLQAGGASAYMSSITAR